MAAPAEGKLVIYTHPDFGECYALVVHSPQGQGNYPPLDLLAFPNTPEFHHYFHCDAVPYSATPAPHTWRKL